MYFLISSILMAILGLVGAVVPPLPGPPFSWLALLLLSFYPGAAISNTQLIIMAVFAVVIVILDYALPAIATKKAGGSKAGIWGCNIGLVVSIIGLPFGPQGILGLILWPFLGAFIGELINHNNFNKALQSAIGAFTGFLCGTGLKLIYAIIVIFMMVLSYFPL